MSGTVVNQAAVMTYIDIFHIIAYVSLGALLLLLFQRAQNRGGESAAH